MTSRNIIVTDFLGFPAVEFTPAEYLMIRVDADARGISVIESIKDCAREFAARRKGIIVDFPTETPASAL